MVIILKRNEPEVKSKKRKIETTKENLSNNLDEKIKIKKGFPIYFIIKYFIIKIFLSRYN